MELVNVPREFSSRYLNEGFSGGEKKRLEILQLALQKPKLAVLDETDSGLDIDALNVVAHGVNTVATGADMGVLIITHYQRILHMVTPTKVSIMFDGPDRHRRRPRARRPPRGRGVRRHPRRVRNAGVSTIADTPLATGFPSLQREGTVYLDTAATSQTQQSVLDAMDDYYEHHRGTVHRSVYPLAAEATELFEGARDRIAAWLNWPARATIFTKNATEAVNLVAYSWGRANVGPGDTVVVSEMEHHSNFVPWHMLCQEVGANFEVIGVDDECVLEARRARRASRDRHGQARRGRACLERRRHDQPGRRHRRAARTPPARSCASTARRPCRRSRSTSARSTPTSTSGRATRSTARRASACCTAAPRSSTRCRRSSAAGT